VIKVSAHRESGARFFIRNKQQPWKRQW